MPYGAMCNAVKGYTKEVEGGSRVTVGRGGWSKEEGIGESLVYEAGWRERDQGKGE